MMSRAIDVWFQNLWYSVITVMDRDSPDVNKYKQKQVGVLVQRKQERVDVIRTTLQETISRMKSMAGKRCRYFPSKIKVMKIDCSLWQTSYYILISAKTSRPIVAKSADLRMFQAIHVLRRYFCAHRLFPVFNERNDSSTTFHLTIKHVNS